MSASVAIIGSGRMGRGIAAAYVAAGRDVALIDIKGRDAAGYAAARDTAEAEVQACLATLRDHGLLQAGADLGTVDHHTPDTLAAALAAAQVIYEGVPEVLEVKREAFAMIDPHLRADAVIASTSSTFVSTELAAMVARPGRLVNAHWLNPAYLVPLVEVSPHPGTDPDATDLLVAELKSVGKVPVLCSPAAGYIVPRLQTLLMNEVARMIGEGVATAEDIDKATRFGLGIRYASMGVAEFIDFGGMDILFYASGYLSRELGPRFECAPIITEKMAADQVGARTGVGLYDWSGVDLETYRNTLTKRLVDRIDLAVADQEETGLVSAPPDAPKKKT